MHHALVQELATSLHVQQGDGTGWGGTSKYPGNCLNRSSNICAVVASGRLSTNRSLLAGAWSASSCQRQCSAS